MKSTKAGLHNMRFLSDFFARGFIRFRTYEGKSAFLKPVEDATSKTGFSILIGCFVKHNTIASQQSHVIRNSLNMGGK